MDVIKRYYIYKYNKQTSTQLNLCSKRKMSEYHNTVKSEENGLISWTSIYGGSLYAHIKSEKCRQCKGKCYYYYFLKQYCFLVQM